MALNLSDFIIETTNEAYKCLASVPLCRKNPGHIGFQSVNDLTVDNLPYGCETEQWLKFIRAWSKRVVRIIVVKPNNGSLYGTGCVYVNTDMFYIKTNEHVIGSQEDVSNCKIEWFYDTEDRRGIETSYGLELLECDKEEDLCYFTCSHTPQTIKQLSSQSTDPPPDTDLATLNHMIAISHPHGGPKTVTFGKYLGGEDVDGNYKFIHTAKTCGGSSGACVIDTSNVNSLDDWQYGWQLTHYAGRRGDVYNIKKDDGTFDREVISATNNINFCAYWW